MKKIGFIGLGVMGLLMCKNLLKAGYSVTVWNRTAAKTKEPGQLGAMIVSSPKEVAQKSDVVIIMVADSADVEEVVCGPLGIIEGSRPDLIVVDMSSISPRATCQIAKFLEKKGVKMLDAPVSGGEIGARDATLSIMVGGPRDTYQDCMGVFSALGKQITYMGTIGSGQAAKLCNQVLCALHIQAVCESLMLATKLGLNLENLVKVLTAGYANSRVLADLGPKMINSDFKPGFKMRHQIKDLKNALSTATDLNLPIPCTSLVYQLFLTVAAMGLEESSTATSILIIENLARQEISRKKRDL